MTPPGTSEVARTSVSVTAGSGRVSDASTTTALPATSGGASRDTRPSSDDVSGATTPTTPVGSGIVKLKYERGDRVRRAEDLGDLVGPAGVPDPAIDRPRHRPRAPSPRAAPRPARPRRRTGRAGPPSARRRGTGPGRGSSRSCRPSPRTPCARPGPRRGGPCGTPDRRSRAACRRRPGRRSTDRTRSAGTRRRCRACTSCGRRSGRPSA